MARRGIAAIGALALPSAGCTMPNPAFGLDEGLGDESGSEAGDGDGESGEGEGDGDGDGDAVCHLEFESPKAVRYELKEAGECKLLDDGIWKAVGEQAAGVDLVGPCDLGCAVCGETGVTMLGAMLDQGGGVLPVCIRLVNEGPFLDPDPLRCNYHAVSAWSGPVTDTPPAFAASALDWGIPEAVTEVFGTLSIERETIDTCDCASVDGCCDPADPPAHYKLLVDGEPVYAGETTTVGVGNLVYEFQNVQSQFSGVCEDPHLIGWALSLAQ